MTTVLAVHSPLGALSWVFSIAQAPLRVFDHIVLNVLGEPPSQPTRGRRRRSHDIGEDEGKMVDPGSDVALVERARGGDKDAFRMLMERYQKRIF